MTKADDKCVDFEEACIAIKKIIPYEANKRARELAGHLNRAFTGFRKSRSDGEASICLSVAILRQATIAISEDIIRLQLYHRIGKPNKYKQAAFIFKWLCKCRPIQLLHPYDADYKERYTRVNAVFAVHFVLALLGCALPEKEQMSELIYTGTFRCIQPEQLASVFYYMKQTIPKDNPK